MTEKLDVTPKTTKQNFIARNGKSEAEVTNNKDYTRGIVLLKLTTGRHEASSGLSAIAELFVFQDRQYPDIKSINRQKDTISVETVIRQRLKCLKRHTLLLRRHLTCGNIVRKGTSQM